MKPWRAIAVLLITILAGCHQAGYQKDRSFRALHIFGVAWIFEKVGTNKIRVFGIGSVDATSLTGTTQTNAPYTMQGATNKVEK